MVVNKAAIVALEKAFRVAFSEAWEQVSDLFWPKIATEFKTTAGSVDYAGMAAIPGMKPLRGSAEIDHPELIEWTIKNDEFHDTRGVKEADIERDQIGVYKSDLKLLAEAAARHPDELCAAALLAGFTAKDYTGKAFFATGKKHFAGAKNTFDNLLTTELAASSFETAREAIKLAKIVFADGTERKLNLGRQLTLIVGPTNESVARTILHSEVIDGSTNINRDTAKLEVWGELGDTANWFLVDAASGVKPLVYQTEKPVSIAMCTDPNDSYVIHNHEFLYQAYGRYNVGYYLPQLIIGSTGADQVA